MTHVETGRHTVILAQGDAGPGDETRLLRAVEDALRLPREHLVSTRGMERPEFKLAEGIDGATAETLAEMARRHGYEPRVLARTGIRWSSHRNPAPFLATQLVLVLGLLFGVRWLGTLAGPMGMGLTALLGMVATMAVIYQWRRSIALPLVVPTHALLTEGADDDPVVEAASGALTALEQLRDVLTTDVPAAARGTLKETHDELRERVDRLRKEARHLPSDAGSASAALETRLATMAPDDPGRSVLQAALDQERAAMDTASTRRSEIIADLLAVRRAASDAACTLAAAPSTDADEALERIRRQAAAMRRAAAEVQQ